MFQSELYEKDILSIASFANYAKHLFSNISQTET